jgi:hypothetical protein
LDLNLWDECCNPQLDSQHHMIAFDPTDNLSISEVTSWQEYVIYFSPVSTGTHVVCKVTFFAEVTSSRAKAVFAEKNHKLIASLLHGVDVLQTFRQYQLDGDFSLHRRQCVRR